MRGNSESIMVYMAEKQYQRLRRYLNQTYLNSTTYFSHLIHGNRLMGRSNELHRAMRTGLNKIYSNVRQIARHQRTAELDADAAVRIHFLMDRICEEVYLLASQKQFGKNTPFMCIRCT